MKPTKGNAVKKLKQFYKDHKTAVEFTTAFILVAAPAAVWTIVGYRIGQYGMEPVGVKTDEETCHLWIKFKNGTEREYRKK